jgi:hypothetical protein
MISSSQSRVEILFIVQILLPVFDNEGRAFDASHYTDVRTELADRFGGLTAYSRAPAEGIWGDEGEFKRDDIVVFGAVRASSRGHGGTAGNEEEVAS